MKTTPRPRPCVSCPYRRSVASGIWHEDEYAKLPRYDAETFAQPPAVFMCHQGDAHVCSGWLGHADPSQLLAVRIGILDGSLDPACAEYETDVPLFSSGAEAAAHGAREIESPSPEAIATIDKVTRARSLTSDPVS